MNETIFMDEKFKAIITGFSGKQDRSQLEPYRKLILELHRRGCSFRKIASVLAENFGLNVVSTTISRFVARLEQEDAKPRNTKPRKLQPKLTTLTTPGKPAPDKVLPPSDEVRQKIAALKQRPAQTESDNAKRFDYNPDQPLHLEFEYWKAKQKTNQKKY